MPDTPKNDFLPFGIETGANVLKPEDYDGLAARKTGFVSGVAKSEELNTVWRQASVIAATFAQYIADRTGKDVLDDGDIAALLQLTKEALNAVQSVSAGNSTHKPDASGNVKLGSVADADIVTSMTDTTAGRVPVVGWEGLGGYALQTADAEIQSQNRLPTRFFIQGSGDADKRFGHYGAGVHIEYGTDVNGVEYSANMFVRADGNIIVEWLQVNGDGSVNNQKKQMLYGPLNPDTSRVAKAGDTMTGALTVPGVINTGDYSLRNLANRHIRFEYLKNDGTWSTDGFIFKDGVDNPTRRPGVRINCCTPDKVKGNTSNSGDWVFSEDGMLTCPGAVSLGTTKKLTIDSNGTSTLGARLHLWGNVDRPTVIEFGDDTSYHFYSQRNKDGSISFVSPGEVVPGNYTNFDSRYLTKSENLPVGIPLPWPTATPPSGWLICNGSAFNKATCPQLAAVYPSGNLPDLRAQFIRGLDNGKNIDTGRAILSTQAGQSPYSSVGSTYGNTSWNSRATVKTGYYMTTGTDNDGTYQIMSESQAQRETRPTNVAFNYIVRAA